MPLIRHNALHQMAERFEPLHAGFSTADAEDLEISFRNDQLIVSFRDWQNQSVLIAFSETAAFLWTSELDPDGFRADAASVVIESTWLEEQANCGNSLIKRSCKHFRLGFNAVGVLNVLATGLDVQRT